MSTFILKYIQKPKYYLRACDNQKGFHNQQVEESIEEQPRYSDHRKGTKEKWNIGNKQHRPKLLKEKQVVRHLLDHYPLG